MNSCTMQFNITALKTNTTFVKLNIKILLTLFQRGVIYEAAISGVVLCCTALLCPLKCTVLHTGSVGAKRLCIQLLNAITFCVVLDCTCAHPLKV